MNKHKKNKGSSFPGTDINTKIEKTSTETETAPKKNKEQDKHQKHHKDYEMIEEDQENYKPGRSNKHWQ